MSAEKFDVVIVGGQVDHDNGRIAADCYLRSTSNSRVYVCGNAVPTSPQLSPIATYEGDLVARTSSVMPATSLSTSSVWQ